MVLINLVVSMRFILLFSLALALSACAVSVPSTSTDVEPDRGDYPDLGAAPELSGDSWLNTPAPLRLAELRGKVVLVDMWTFG